MVASLNDPLAKLHRAKQHFNYLDRAVLRGLKSNRYGIIPKTDGSGAAARLGVSEARKLGVRIGDVIHNTRAALDYLIWQLVIANGEQPDFWNEFPIALKPEQFPGTARGISHLEGVSDTAVDFIKSAQPYVGVGNLKLHPLATLKQLSNTDKHRTLVPVRVGYRTKSVETKHRLPGGTVLSVRVSSFFPGGDSGVVAAFEDGANAITFSDAQREVDMKQNITPLITFDKSAGIGNRDVLVVLDKSVKEVQRILKEARPFI